MSLAEATRQQIQAVIDSDAVVLFMKGSREMPRCGFSARTVEILDQLVAAYTTVDVLADPEIRQGIKEFSSWPTIPQLYVGGQFLGGSDIVAELYETGELKSQIDAAARARTAKA